MRFFWSDMRIYGCFPHNMYEDWVCFTTLKKEFYCFMFHTHVWLIERIIIEEFKTIMGIIMTNFSYHLTNYGVK